MQLMTRWHRRRSPRLTPPDRFSVGLCSLFLHSRQIARAAIIVRPLTWQIYYASRSLFQSYQWPADYSLRQTKRARPPLITPRSNFEVSSYFDGRHQALIYSRRLHALATLSLSFRASLKSKKRHKKSRQWRLLDALALLKYGGYTCHQILLLIKAYRALISFIPTYIPTNSLVYSLNSGTFELYYNIHRNDCWFPFSEPPSNTPPYSCVNIQNFSQIRANRLQLSVLIERNTMFRQQTP